MVLDKVPLLLPLLTFLVGIFLADFAGLPDLPWLLPAVAGLSLAAGLAYALRGRFLLPRNLPVVLGLLAVLMLGFWRSGDAHLPNKTNYFAPVLAQENLLGAEIISLRASERSLRLIVDAETIYKDTLGRPATGRLLVYLPPDIKSASLRAGDRILVQGDVSTISPPLNPATFDAPAYWASQGIYHQLRVRDSKAWRHLPNESWAPRAAAERVRKWWFKSFQPYLVGDDLAVASALIMGKKDLLTTEVRSQYSDTGAMHVLAVSGLHVGIILLILRSLFQLLPGRNSRSGRFLETLVTVLAIWAFAYVSGLSPSVRRAAIMFSIIAAGRLTARHSYLLNTLAGAALLMLVLEPGQWRQIGFQLSFLALLGIVWFATPLQRLVPGRGWPWESLKAGVAASIGAQLGTLPVALYVFRSFPLYFMLSGSAVVIFAYLAMCGGLLHGAIYACFGFGELTNLTGWALARIIELQNAFIYAFAQLPGGVLELQTFSIWSALLTFACVLALAHYVNYRKRTVLYAALLLLAVTIISALPQVRGDGASSTVTVYHLSRKSLVDWTNPEGAFALGDELEPDRIDFQVSPNRKELGYTVDSILAIADLETIDINGTTWLILDGKRRDRPVDITAPYVLIRNDLRPGAFADVDIPPETTLIVDGSNPPWRYADWEAFAEERGVEVWVTGIRGAFLIRGQ
ncbi:hypothetical protein A3850_002720 [Lewinella sp. 4G2]|nr:hypothetical protein A3850_002720 [Lewinella sp. 4G2]